MNKYNSYLYIATMMLFTAFGASWQWFSVEVLDFKNSFIYPIICVVIAAVWFSVWLISRKLPTPRRIAAKYAEIRSGIYQGIEDSIDFEHGKYGNKHSPLDTFYSTVNMRRRSLPPLAAKAYKHYIYDTLDSPSFKALDKAWRARH